MCKNSVKKNYKEPIAIVGIGCRFPGGVKSPRAFWHLLVNQGHAISEIPPDRFDLDAYYDPTPATPGKIMSRWGGFLDKIDQFDAGFFGISPREAERLDPQQRLLLETTWESFEDAGISLDDLYGTSTGVFVGMWLNDYEARMFADPGGVDFYMTTGSGRYSASGRISYSFGLQGPSITVDTACSSSLVAVHLACQSLWNGQCSQAVVGGANIILQPHITIAYSQSQMMAPDGRCKFGDARANGYVRSDGAGVVVLKPLSAAMADGDQVYAVIRGSAVNNDGRSSDYMATPGQEGQAEMLRQAYQDAGVSPGDVHYVEAHGTGTLVGDPIEINALGTVLATGRRPGDLCKIGSVKTNIGHTEGASGVAGLIKSALILKNRIVPPSLNVEELNPNINWEEIPLVIARELSPITEEIGRATAGVSSFGIAGTNAHVVLEEAPLYPHVVVETDAPSFEEYLLPLSARSAESLKALAEAYGAYLPATEEPLSDICYTASQRRSHLEYRLAVSGRSKEELAGHLVAFAEGEADSSIVSSEGSVEQQPGVVFVFPGQGAQWTGMARQLLAQEPIFREAMIQCAEAIQPHVDWSLLDQLDADETDFRFDEINVIQPVLFAIQVALTALWRSWGIEPDAVLGHSMGEVAAAYVAGALKLEDAARIICLRSQLMSRVSGQGAMAVVGLTLEEAADALDGDDGRLSVAVSNSPRSTVISGDPEALEELLGRLEKQDIFCRKIKVDVASHSPHMNPLSVELLGLLEGLESHLATVPIYSTVHGNISDGSDMTAGYWARNLRQPVLFSSQTKQLAENGHTIFIELSPHPILLPAVEQTFHFAGYTGHTVPSMRRDEDERAIMLASLGNLYVLGCNVSWSQINPPSRLVRLPSYPWDHRRYWIESETPDAGLGHSSEIGIVVDHPLLGHRLPDLAHLPGDHIWVNKLDTNFRHYLSQQQEHRIHEADAIYSEMALAAVRSRYGNNLHTVTELNVQKSLDWSDEVEPGIQFILSSPEDGLASFQVFSKEEAGSDEWERFASGLIDVSQAPANWLYDLEWQLEPESDTDEETALDAEGHWLILADKGGTGEALASLLAELGATSKLVYAGDANGSNQNDHLRINPSQPRDFQQLLAEAGSSYGGIVHLWSLDAPATEQATLASIEESQILSGESILHLLKAVAKQEGSQPVPVWAVTRGVQPVEIPEGQTLSVMQSLIWGIGRTATLENPELWRGLIDLPVDATADDASLILAEIGRPGTEDQIVVRNGNRYLARLVSSLESRARIQPFSLDPEATYMITGGLGSIGLQLARWMVEQGATELLLTSRSGLPDRSDWGDLAPDTSIGARIAVVRDLEAMGITVEIGRADVADMTSMSQLLANLDKPLRGIIHGAGVVDMSRLVDMDAAVLHEVLRPKVSGAWVLHQLTQEMDIDFMVFFSSGAAAWGSQGLGHYAAANHFIDILAHYRRSRGLAALSVNWGWWEGGGLTTDELAQLFSQSGLEIMPSDQAIAAMTYLLRTGAVQKVVAAIDWRLFKPIYEARGERLLLAQIEVHAETPDQHPGEEQSDFSQRIKEAPAEEQWNILLAYVHDEVASVLGFESGEMLDPRQGFFKMGMDSMTTMQLRIRLEATLAHALPPTVAFEYPSVESLARYLADEVLDLDSSQAAGELTEEVEPIVESNDEETSIGEDELLAMLDDELSRIDDLME